MAPSQREAYDQFHAQALLELEEGFLDGSLPGVAVIRARQIMAHPEALPNPTYTNLMKLVKAGEAPKSSLDGVPKTVNILKKGEITGKDERLEIHLAENEPLIIFSALVPEQERIMRICKKAGRKEALINGSVDSKTERPRIDAAFRAGELDVVVASPMTAGVGFNWGHVNHVIFASLDYMDDSFIQAYRRTIRGKRETPVRITILEYRDSIDQRIIQIVEEKSESAHKVDETYQRLGFHPRRRER